MERLKWKLLQFNRTKVVIEFYYENQYDEWSVWYIKVPIHSLLVSVTLDGISPKYESGEGRGTKVT